MNRIEVAVEGIEEPAWISAFIAFAGKVLVRLGRDGWDLSFLLCDDATMKSLNSQYRSKDESTDVLSFAPGETVRDEEFGDRWVAGDIAISLDMLAGNAEYFGVSQDEELRRLALHGILHLDGNDHEDNDPERPMLRLQEEIMAELTGERILP